MSYNSFIKIWHELVPHIKFQPSASDLCETCANFKAELAIIKDDIELNNKKIQYKEH